MNFRTLNNGETGYPEATVSTRSSENGLHL
jgi:hypothetical protein